MSLQIDSAALEHRIAVLEEIGVGPLWLRRSLTPASEQVSAAAPATAESAPAPVSARTAIAPHAPHAPSLPAAKSEPAADGAAWDDGALHADAAPVKTNLTLCTRIDVNDSRRYLFVARASSVQGSEELFANILSALGMRKEAGAQGDLAGLAAQLKAQRPSALIAMGPAIAQELIGQAQQGADAEAADFAALRGRLHRVGDLPLLVTYDATHLLRHPADKRGAWDDFCLLTGLQAADVADPA